MPRGMDRHVRQCQMQELGTSHAQQESDCSAGGSEHNGLSQEKGEDGATRGAKSNEQANFIRALGHGDRHDGYDADPADDQRNSAQSADGSGQNVEDVGQCREHVFLRDYRKIFPAMPAFKQRFDGVDDFGGRHAFPVSHMDFHQSIAIVKFQ